MKKKYKEKDIVELMIKIYCDKNHGNKGQEKDENGLCPHCKELVDYAFVLKVKKKDFAAAVKFTVTRRNTGLKSEKLWHFQGGES